MRRMRSRSQPEMTVVVYELAIIGGQLPDDASAAFEQVEALHRIVSGMDGTEVGPWEWYVPTFDLAREAAREFRRIGLAFDDVEIKAVDGLSGKDLPSSGNRRRALSGRIRRVAQCFSQRRPQPFTLFVTIARGDAASRPCVPVRTRERRPVGQMMRRFTELSRFAQYVTDGPRYKEGGDALGSRGHRIE